jgi:hypothetical protein
VVANSCTPFPQVVSLQAQTQHVIAKALRLSIAPLFLFGCTCDTCTTSALPSPACPSTNTFNSFCILSPLPIEAVKKARNLEPSASETPVASCREGLTSELSLLRPLLLPLRHHLALRNLILSDFFAAPSQASAPAPAVSLIIETPSSRPCTLCTLALFFCDDLTFTPSTAQSLPSRQHQHAFLRPQLYITSSN